MEYVYGDSFPRVCVVGLGEIGSSVFKELAKHRVTSLSEFELIGVDINPERWDAVRSKVEGEIFGPTVPDNASIYLICVWNMNQILKVIRTIGEETNGFPLIVIESTIDISRATELGDLIQEQQLQVVAFPHRWNPNDPEHGVLNQDRVIGGEPEAVARALEFYSPFLQGATIHCADFWTAAFTKVAENAYRFLEIAAAQELKEMATSIGVDFKQLRQLMNTKWNIDVREAREGVGGKCLPKDMAIFNATFPKNCLFKMAEMANEQYKNSYKSSTSQ